MDPKEKLSEHFTLGELIKSQIAEEEGIDNNPPEELIPKLGRLCSDLLEPIRDHFGVPFSPNSNL